MTMWKSTFVALAFVAANLGSAAMAESENHKGCMAGGQHMSDEAITQMLTKEGYDVRRLKPENGCIEAYAISPSGKRVELIIDPSTGKIVGSED